MATKTTPRKVSGTTPKSIKSSTKARPQNGRRDAKPERSTTKKGSVTRKRFKTATPPAASVAAAEKVLRSVQRREDALRKALKRQKKTLDQLKKAATTHRGTVKSLKSDLREVSKTRKTVSSHL